MKIDSSNALQILLLMGGLSRVPVILFTVTPPNQVRVGIALFLTLFVMAPTISAIKKDAWEPLQHHQIKTATAIKRAEEPLREFMFRQTRNQDISLFVSLARAKTPQTRAQVPPYVLTPPFSCPSSRHRSRSGS